MRYGEGTHSLVLAQLGKQHDKHCFLGNDYISQKNIARYVK